MHEVAALFRARLAAALRDLPSELRGGKPRRPLPGATSLDLRGVAERLESASPGLALLMQLRARLFEGAAMSASRRRFDQVVMVGRGFGGCVREGVCPRLQVIEIEHPAVLGAWESLRGRRTNAAMLAAENLERDAWMALSGSEFAPRHRRTLFLIEGMSLWGSANALSFWLDTLGRESAVGSEMLVNLLDADGAERARAAVENLQHIAGAATVVNPARVDVRTLRATVAAHSLELLHVFDSHTVQSAYLGFADLFVCEHYLWMKTPGARPITSEGPLRGVLRPRSRPAARSIPARPRLRDGAWARHHPSGVARLGFAVTPLRACSISISADELATASLFDGCATSAEIASTLSRLSDVHSLSDVVGFVRRLQARGLLAYDSADPACNSLIDSFHDKLRPTLGDASAGLDCRLGVIRELAFVALESRDRTLRGRVAHLLADVDGNGTADHLRGMLQADGILLVRAASVAVSVRRPTTMQEARDILAAAIDTVGAIGRLLDVGVTTPVLVDVATQRDAIPITLVADAVPYTLVRIARPRYSLSVLHHELTHVLAMCGSTWLSEGLAVWVQRRLAPGTCFPDDAPIDRTPVRRSLADQLVGERDLRERSRARRLDATDYRQAGDYVAWLMSRFGFPTLARIFDACWAGVREPVDAACRAMGFESLRDLEQEWRSCQ